MEDELQKAGSGVKRAWPVVMSWVGGISALIGLSASIAGGVSWYRTRHQHQLEHQSQMALAQTQSKQGEYQAALQTYAAILKSDSLDRAALDQQLDTAMLWVENPDLPPIREGQSAADTDGPALDQVMTILDSGFTRSTGTRAADVQAHIGWAHWLNEKLQREFGPAAEQSLRAALTADPSNVYANAMLGNWLLNNGGTLSEVMQHFNAAIASGKARPFVRQLELVGLIYHDVPGARAELVKVANDMRQAGEPIGDGSRNRILGFCFDPIVTDHKELSESLTAVPPDDAWKTYLWLDSRPQQEPGPNLVHDFIAANLLELQGKRPESLAAFRTLQQKLKQQSGRMKDNVDAAVTSLSRN